MNAQDETAKPSDPPSPAAGGAVSAAVLAERLRGLAPSCGPVRLVGIDGHAGSGKSTLALRVAEALGGAPVLRLDDFASHERCFGWTGRFAAQVLEPFAHGESAVFRPYDWHARRPGRTRTAAPAPVVLVEGVGAGRRALRPWLSLLWWMDLAREAAWERGRERDGPDLADFWDGWERAEAAHFRADPSRPFADALVQECGEGYVLRK
ncbi:Uridine kinase [Streptomyces sp. DfronAA-171]|nr:Uridine kinase [Streptomyces sp. DfronAA-171]